MPNERNPSCSQARISVNRILVSFLCFGQNSPTWKLQVSWRMKSGDVLSFFDFCWSFWYQEDDCLAMKIIFLVSARPAKIKIRAGWKLQVSWRFSNLPGPQISRWPLVSTGNIFQKKIKQSRTVTSYRGPLRNPCRHGREHWHGWNSIHRATTRPDPINKTATVFALV